MKFYQRVGLAATALIVMYVDGQVFHHNMGLGFAVGVFCLVAAFAL